MYIMLNHVFGLFSVAGDLLNSPTVRSAFTEPVHSQSVSAASEIHFYLARHQLPIQALHRPA